MSLFDDLPEPSADASQLDTGKFENDITASNRSSSLDENTNATPFRFLSAAVGRKGERPEMQDAHVIIENLLVYFKSLPSTEVERLSYFAVFDGHGGARAAEFAAKRLHLQLVSRFPRGGVKQIEKDIRRVVYDAYKKTDEDFLREAIQQRPHWRDGSTAATALLINNTLYLANLGDSKIVLARMVHGNSQLSTKKDTPDPEVLSALCLTRDHNPIDFDERERIQARGATVYNGRVNNVLEVTRSFGDYQFKKQGVTCIPDVRKCQLTSSDKFLLIACDGLWKTFPPNDAIIMVDRLLQQEIVKASNENELYQKSKTNSIEQLSSDCLLTQRRVETVCAQIVNEAVLRMSGDNVTCILIVFPDAFATPSKSHSTTAKVRSPSPTQPTDGDEIPTKISRIEKLTQ